ncbi:MAG: hypothetical protein V1908_02465 [Candidatus Peregrinibacteria bacterium]
MAASGILNFGDYPYAETRRCHDIGDANRSLVSELLQRIGDRDMCLEYDDAARLFVDGLPDAEAGDSAGSRKVEFDYDAHARAIIRAARLQCGECRNFKCPRRFEKKSRGRRFRILIDAALNCLR